MHRNDHLAQNKSNQCKHDRHKDKTNERRNKRKQQNKIESIAIRICHWRLRADKTCGSKKHTNARTTEIPMNRQLSKQQTDHLKARPHNCTLKTGNASDDRNEKYIIRHPSKRSRRQTCADGKSSQKYVCIRACVHSVYVCENAQIIIAGWLQPGAKKCAAETQNNARTTATTWNH